MAQHEMAHETAIALRAIAAAAGKAEDRAAMRPGRYAVHASATVCALVTVGEDRDAAVAAAVPVWQILSLAVQKMNGVTIDALVREALALEDVGESDATDADATRARAEEAVRTIRRSRVRTVRGPVRVVLTHPIDIATLGVAEGGEW